MSSSHTPQGTQQLKRAVGTYGNLRRFYCTTLGPMAGAGHQGSSALAREERAPIWAMGTSGAPPVCSFCKGPQSSPAQACRGPGGQSTHLPQLKAAGLPPIIPQELPVEPSESPGSLRRAEEAETGNSSLCWSTLGFRTPLLFLGFPPRCSFTSQADPSSQLEVNLHHFVHTPPNVLIQHHLRMWPRPTSPCTFSEDKPRMGLQEALALLSPSLPITYESIRRCTCY